MSSVEKFAVIALASFAMSSPASAGYGRFDGGRYNEEPTPVPESATFGLFGLGLAVGIVAYRVRRKRSDRD